MFNYFLMLTTMRKMMTALTALFLMAGASAWAQENKSETALGERPTTEQMARKATDRMTLRLKLTDEQAEQVYEVVLERLRATEAVREQVRAAKSAEAEKMKSILSTEQFMRWAQSQVPHERRRAPQAGKKERPGRAEAPKDRRERR